MGEEIYESSLRSAGDLGAFFEYDGETAYFYLWDGRRPKGHKVVDAIHITSQEVDFNQDDICVEWDASQTIVGLLVKNRLWAAFDEKGTSQSERALQ